MWVNASREGGNAYEKVPQKIVYLFLHLYLTLYVYGIDKFEAYLYWFIKN